MRTYFCIQALSTCRQARSYPRSRDSAQRALDDRHLAECAAALDLPRPQILTAIEEHSYLLRIREDFMSGVRSGVNGTPTFFINGVRHDGSYDLETLLAAIAEAIG
jgi:protein-disulfide isomerase